MSKIRVLKVGSVILFHEIVGCRITQAFPCPPEPFAGKTLAVTWSRENSPMNENSYFAFVVPETEFNIIGCKYLKPSNHEVKKIKIKERQPKHKKLKNEKLKTKNVHRWKLCRAEKNGFVYRNKIISF